MNTQNINWDKVPETLSWEQFHKLVHVSKKAAKTLLLSNDNHFFHACIKCRPRGTIGRNPGDAIKSPFPEKRGA